jgi:hypothetical protein
MAVKKEPNVPSPDLPPGARVGSHYAKGRCVNVNHMSEHSASTPASQRVEIIDGEASVFTPCCGARVVLPPDEATPGPALDPVCPRDGVGWRLRLVTGDTADSGLRAAWTPPDEETTDHHG